MNENGTPSAGESPPPAPAQGRIILDVTYILRKTVPKKRNAGEKRFDKFTELSSKYKRHLYSVWMFRIPLKHFTDSQASDLTIKRGTISWAVHRSVVCPRITFLAEACAPGNKLDGCVTLQGGHVPAIHSMLDFIYTGDYDELAFAERDGYGALRLNLLVLDIADKYNLPELWRVARKKFTARAWTHYMQPVFAEIVEEIFSISREEDKHLLRDVVLKICANKATDLLGEHGVQNGKRDHICDVASPKWFTGVLNENPRFAGALAARLAKNIQNAADRRRKAWVKRTTGVASADVAPEATQPGASHVVPDSPERTPLSGDRPVEIADGLALAAIRLRFDALSLAQKDLEQSHQELKNTNSHLQVAFGRLDQRQKDEKRDMQQQITDLKALIQTPTNAQNVAPQANIAAVDARISTLSALVEAPRVEMHGRVAESERRIAESERHIAESERRITHSEGTIDMLDADIAAVHSTTADLLTAHYTLAERVDKLGG